MKYSKPGIERLNLVGYMISKQSICILEGGRWDGQECHFPA